MPRRCTVCDHAERDQIDRLLVGGWGSNRAIACHFRVGRMALQRHAARHLHPVLARAHEAQEMARADDLVGQLRFLQERALAMLTTAEAQGDRKVALGAMREARANLELSAKLLGELGERATVNVTLTPEWRGVQARVLEALAPYPELRARVAGALIGARSDDGHAGSNGPGPSA